MVNKLMEIGRSIIKGESTSSTQSNESERALQALKWMTRAFSIVDRGNKESIPPPLRVSPSLVGIHNLLTIQQRMILRGLGRKDVLPRMRFIEVIKREPTIFLQRPWQRILIKQKPHSKKSLITCNNPKIRLVHY